MYMKLKHVLISSVSLIQGCSLRGPGFTNKGSTHRTLPDTLLKCQVTAISKKACNIIISCTTSYQCSHQSILYEAITFICLLKIKCNVHSLHCNALQCTLQCTMFKTRAEDMTIWNISSQLEKNTCSMLHTSAWGKREKWEKGAVNWKSGALSLTLSNRQLIAFVSYTYNIKCALDTDARL